MKALLERLNPFLMEKFQRASSMSQDMGHYVVSPEHLLARCAEAPDADIALILKHYGQDPGRFVAELEAAMEEFKSGNAGRPSMSPLLAELVQEAWLLSSIDLGKKDIRSGALLLAALSGQTIPLTVSWMDSLRPVSRDGLMSRFADIVAASQESASGEEGEAVSSLAHYCIDYTARARAGDMDPIFGRERELRQIIDILSRRRKNNPIIVGDAGVGKTAMVEGLALRIASGEAPDILRGVSLLGLDLGLLEAGAGVKGEFENRLKKVISEIQESDKSIILFIDEAHTLIGAGGRVGGQDAANLLKPLLARGELRTIAATTWSEYKRYFERDAALSRRFQPVKLEEPSVASTSLILRGLKLRYEESHVVTIRDDAAQAAAELADRYISGRQLPDKAVDLLDTAAARVKVSLSCKPPALEDMERAMGDLHRWVEALDRDRDNGLPVDVHALEEARVKLRSMLDGILSLENKWRQERLAVDNLFAARKRLAQARSGTEMGASPHELAKQVETALQGLALAQAGKPLIQYEVDPDAIARVVSDWTGVPLGKVLRDEAVAVLRMEELLGERILGQPATLQTIARRIRAAKSGLRDPRLPLGAFLLTGPSGVGKTETALAVSDVLFGDENACLALNMSEFQERHTVSRLIGSPPGYLGYGEGGVLTETVRQRPYSVILLDGAEKCHPEVLTLFSQVLDRGVMADGEGRVVDFSNTIIFLTTTLGVEELLAALENGGPASPEGSAAHAPLSTELLVAAVKPALDEHFRASFLSHLTISPLLPLHMDALTGIAERSLQRLAGQALAEHHARFSFTRAVPRRVAELAAKWDMGARAVAHVLHTAVLPRVSEEVLRRLSLEQDAGFVRLDVADDGDFMLLESQE